MKILFAAMLTNLAGAAFGFLYYKTMFASLSLKYWIFIPDSPLSTLIFSISILLILIGKKNNLLSFAACVYVMKYGFWTVFVILFYSGYFLAPQNAPFYWLMFVLHLGMIIEPVFILRTIEPRRGHLLFLLFWFLLNDYVDYWLGITPLSMFSFSRIEVVRNVSIASSIVFSFAVYLAPKQKSINIK
ncbi:MAG: DUF1405 domain-containing protein [Euryarchaeota archaeon]|nr:DUF1405 domain-containing protein [Euryarchaeota archaeon]